MKRKSTARKSPRARSRARAPSRSRPPARRGRAPRWSILAYWAGTATVLVLSAVLAAAALQARGCRRAKKARRVTIPEGWTSFQIAHRLAESGVCPEGAFVAASRDPVLLSEFGISAPSVEGYLFPATYDMSAGSDPDSILRVLVREGRRRIGEIFDQHRTGFEKLHEQLGWGEVEVLTLASIVEKEALVDEERPLIAAVYLNRLTDPEFRPARRLQADPTAAYGCVVAPGAAPSCAGYDGRITPRMLRDSKNRYNTYRHPGLPPGPIANPGEASIASVLEPADTDHLYFVATGKGRHVFSRTYSEHKAAIQRTKR